MIKNAVKKVRNKTSAEPFSGEDARILHVEELLDEALRQTFPASDPPAMLQPAPTTKTLPENGHGVPRFAQALNDRVACSVTERYQRSLF